MVRESQGKDVPGPFRYAVAVKSTGGVRRQRQVAVKSTGGVRRQRQVAVKSTGGVRRSAPGPSHPQVAVEVPVAGPSPQHGALSNPPLEFQALCREIFEDCRTIDDLQMEALAMSALHVASEDCLTEFLTNAQLACDHRGKVFISPVDFQLAKTLM